MTFELLLISCCFGLFVGMILFLEIGRRIGHKKFIKDREGYEKGGGAIEGAVFGLLGLLIAFTFSGAASRFEDRRHLITEEANAIGTAYLRLDLLPAETQPKLRALFRQYAHNRATAYRNADSDERTAAALAAGAALQTEIWSLAW